MRTENGRRRARPRGEGGFRRDKGRQGASGRTLAGGLGICLLLTVSGCGSGAKKELTDSRAATHFRIGARYLQEGQLRAAVQELGRATELRPRDAVYRNSLGLAYFSLGEYDLAEQELKKALQLDPAFTDVHNNLALVYSEQDRYELAEAHYRKALADPAYLTPEKVYLNRGKTLSKQGDREGAEAMYRKAVEVSPRYARGHYELGLLLEEEGDTEGALEAYLLAWTGMSRVPELNLRLGELFLRKGNAVQARQYLGRVIDAAPDSLEAVRARAYLDRMPPG